MPRKGYRTVHVTDNVYSYLEKQAKETNHTIPDYIRLLVDKNSMAKGRKLVLEP